jgi:high-affinity iron transporter
MRVQTHAKAQPLPADLKRVELTHLSKYVWMGAGAGILASIVIGVVFILLFYLAKNAAISGGGQNLLESILRLVACAVITALAFGMTKIMNMSGKFRAKLEKLTRQIGNEPKTHWGLLCFAFTCVLREGIESVLFLAGVSSGFSAGMHTP